MPINTCLQQLDDVVYAPTYTLPKRNPATVTNQTMGGAGGGLTAANPYIDIAGSEITVDICFVDPVTLEVLPSPT
jgi:hypothetical protein